ncbi:MAG: hypothetical protein ACK4KV_23795 [Rhodocyclaceae bacterium]
MATPTRGFANRNDQVLGMPAVSVFVPPIMRSIKDVAVTELRVPADGPLTLVFMSKGDGQRQCFARGWFVPEAGADYEVSFRQVGSACRLMLHRLRSDGTGGRVVPVALSPTDFCRASDNL